MIVPNFRGASPVDRHHSSLAKPPRFARRLVYYRGPILRFEIERLMLADRAFRLVSHLVNLTPMCDGLLPSSDSTTFCGPRARSSKESSKCAHGSQSSSTRCMPLGVPTLEWTVFFWSATNEVAVC